MIIADLDKNIIIIHMNLKNHQLNSYHKDRHQVN